MHRSRIVRSITGHQRHFRLQLMVDSEPARLPRAGLVLCAGRLSNNTQQLSHLGVAEAGSVVTVWGWKSPSSANGSQVGRKMESSAFPTGDGWNSKDFSFLAPGENLVVQSSFHKIKT